MVDITGLRDLKPIGAATNMAKEFRDFLLKTNLLSLAMAVVIGNAVTAVVNSIVADLLGGLLKVVSGTAGGWHNLNFTVWRIEFRFGSFFGVLLNFVMVAGIVFFITRAFIRSSPPPPPPPSKPCPACREAIHPDASRCKFCTSEQPRIEVAAAPPPPPAA